RARRCARELQPQSFETAPAAPRRSRSTEAGTVLLARRQPVETLARDPDRNQERRPCRPFFPRSTPCLVRHASQSGSASPKDHPDSPSKKSRQPAAPIFPPQPRQPHDVAVTRPWFRQTAAYPIEQPAPPRSITRE